MKQIARSSLTLAPGTTLFDSVARAAYHHVLIGIPIWIVLSASGCHRDSPEAASLSGTDSRISANTKPEGAPRVKQTSRPDVDREGIVRWAHADRHYKVRPSAAQIVSAIDALRLPGTSMK